VNFEHSLYHLSEEEMARLVRTLIVDPTIYVVGVAHVFPLDASEGSNDAMYWKRSADNVIDMGPTGSMSSSWYVHNDLSPGFRKSCLCECPQGSLIPVVSHTFGADPFLQVCFRLVATPHTQLQVHEPKVVTLDTDLDKECRNAAVEILMRASQGATSMVAMVASWASAIAQRTGKNLAEVSAAITAAIAEHSHAIKRSLVSLSETACDMTGAWDEVTMSTGLNAVIRKRSKLASHLMLWFDRMIASGFSPKWRFGAAVLSFSIMSVELAVGGVKVAFAVVTRWATGFDVGVTYTTFGIVKMFVVNLTRSLKNSFEAIFNVKTVIVGHTHGKPRSGQRYYNSKVCRRVWRCDVDQLPDDCKLEVFIGGQPLTHGENLICHDYSRGAMMLGPSALENFVFCQCPVSMCNALTRRYLVPQSDIRPASVVHAGHVISVIQPAFEREFHATSDPRRLAPTLSKERAQLWAEMLKPDANPGRVGGFVKSEKMIKIIPGMQVNMLSPPWDGTPDYDTTAKERAIFPMLDACKIKHKAIHSRVLNATKVVLGLHSPAYQIDGKDFVVVTACGLNAIELGQAYEQMAHWSSGKNTILYERDLKTFEATQQVDHFEMIYRLWSCTGADFIGYLRRGHHTNGKVVYRKGNQLPVVVKFEYDGRMASGRNHTTSSNTWLNYLSTAQLLRVDHVLGVFAIIMGDDMIASVHVRDVEPHDAYKPQDPTARDGWLSFDAFQTALRGVEAEFGLVPEGACFSHTRMCDLTFCSGRMYLTAYGGLVHGPLIGRLLARLWWSPKELPDSLVNRWCKTVAVGLAGVCYYLPIAGPLIRWALHLECGVLSHEQQQHYMETPIEMRPMHTDQQVRYIDNIYDYLSAVYRLPRNDIAELDAALNRLVGPCVICDWLHEQNADHLIPVVRQIVSTDMRQDVAARAAVPIY
jgi:hypothetical protein